MDKILKLLEDDATLTPEQLSVMLGKEVGDIKKMILDYEKEGVILGYKTLVDWDKTSREYVTLKNGNDGYLSEAELSILSSKENGIEYVIEEATNISKIYYCHLSKNTKTQKTYVSSTFISENGLASYIIIHVENSGAWYKTQNTYKGFSTPSASDSGKILTVYENGVPVWMELDMEKIATYVLERIENGNGVAY